jgi:arabinofuranan 3-O-arabinosyltransferase
MCRMPVVRDKLARFEAWFFTERRIRFYGLGVLVAYVIGLAVKSFWHIWLFQKNGKPLCTDFITLWLTGIFAGSNNPTRMYDDLAWSTAWKTLTGMEGGEGCPLAEGQYSYPHNSYPPLLLFFTYPLGSMPYTAAFATWTVATLLLYLIAIYLIVPRPIAILAAFTPFPVFFNLFLGQNGFLLAGLMGLSLVLMERRPQLSGIFLGLLTFKPQIGILFPLALLVSRKWRVIGSATATSLVLIVTSIVVFGYQGWPKFIHTLFDRPSLGMRLESVYGFVGAAGMSSPTAWAIHLAFAGVITAIVSWAWARPLPHTLKAAALCSAGALATPYVHGHDLCVLAIAAAFLVRDGLERGVLPGDRLIMLFSWIVLFLGFRDFTSGWISSLALLAVVVRRVRMISTLDREALASMHCSDVRPPLIAGNRQ